MTVNISNIDANTNNFQFWLDKTNEAITALNDVVVTVNSGSPPSGNGVIDGTFQSNILYTTELYGGEIGNTATLLIQTSSQHAANTTFLGSRNSFANTNALLIPGSNTSHRVLAANTSSNRLRYVFGALLDETNPPGDLTIDGNITGNGDLVISGNTTLDGPVTANGDFTVTGNTNLDVLTVNTVDSTNNITYQAEVIFNQPVVFNANFSFEDRTITVANTSMNFNATSKLNLENIDGTEKDVAKSINNIRTDILAFAIALG